MLKEVLDLYGAPTEYLHLRVENYTTAPRKKSKHIREFTTRLKLLFNTAFPGVRPEYRDLQILSKMRGQLKDGKLNDILTISSPGPQRFRQLHGTLGRNEEHGIGGTTEGEPTGRTTQGQVGTEGLSTEHNLQQMSAERTQSEGLFHQNECKSETVKKHRIEESIFESREKV